MRISLQSSETSDIGQAQAALNQAIPIAVRPGESLSEINNKTGPIENLKTRCGQRPTISGGIWTHQRISIRKPMISEFGNFSKGSWTTGEWAVSKIKVFDNVKRGKRLSKENSFSDRKNSHQYIKFVDIIDGRISSQSCRRLK